MNKLVKLMMATAVSVACTAASADVVTFEQFGLPGIYTNGDVLTNGVQRITVIGQGGLDGALVNSLDSTSCDIVVCPAGTSPGFYLGLNDGGFKLDLVSGETFKLSSLSFGFVLPSPTVINFSVGQLVVQGDNGVQLSQDFAAQQGGLFRFTNMSLTGLGLVNSATVFACLYDGTGFCVNPANYQAQFAVDDINFTVPEPTGMALSALALAGLIAARRRNKAQ